MASGLSFSQPASAFVSPSLNAYLAACTQTELNAILDVIHSIVNKTPAPNMPNVQHKVTKTKRVAPATGLKRPLNSWMAFRTYYNSVLGAQQQKDISGLLPRLWREDPFHAKWAILAKAYSVIRDYKGIVQPELDTFLSICCPQIGIIGPEHYLQMLGWDFGLVDGVKTLTRIFVPNASDLGEHLTNATLSVEDIISCCHEVGYVDTDNMDVLGGRSSLTMATPMGPQSKKLGVSSWISFPPPTSASSNPSFTAFTTPASSPYDGYVSASSFANPGLGIPHQGVSGNIVAAPTPFNGIHFNGAVTNINSASTAGNFQLPNGGLQPCGNYNFADYTGLYNDKSKQGMYYRTDDLVTGYDGKSMLEPLAGNKFDAFNVSQSTDADFGAFEAAFNEEMYINFDFDGHNG